MTDTTYGTWANHARQTTVENSVVIYLAEFEDGFEDGFDVDGLTRAYRDAVNEALPEGVRLIGNEFYGPDPRPDDHDEIIATAIDSIDLEDLLPEHDLNL